MKKYLIGLFITILALNIEISASAKNFNAGIKQESFDVVVNSKSGPWVPVINKSKDFRFNAKHDSELPPAILKVKPGDNLTVQYIDGYVYADRLGHPERKTDADGYPKTMRTYAGSLPSSYINDQINHMALIGTFANSKGLIIGTPFLIGDGPTNIVAPEGASQLQLGINDNLFKDNSGLFIVKININN